MWSQKNHVTKRRFPNYFWFHPPVLQGPFTRWVYSKVDFYTQFHKTLWDHGGSNPWEKPGSSNAKTEQWLISPGKPRAVDNMHSFYDLPN